MMSRRRLLIIFVLVLMAGLLFLTLAEADEPTARFFLFSSDACPHCLVIRDEFLPAILQKYEGQIDVKFFDIAIPQNYDILLALEERYGIVEAQIPEIFIGDEVLTGEEEIETKLEGLIQDCLRKGGCNFPSPDLPFEETLPPTPTVAPSGLGEAIHLAYFYAAGCQECDRARYDLNLLQKRYPQLKIESFSVQEDAALSEWLGERYGVPEDRRLTVPAVFLGDDYLLGEEVNARNLEALIERYIATGAEPTWAGWEEEAKEAKAGIIERFKSFGILTIVAAGLIDGVNPCAFATIIFFVSYLTLVGRRGREVIIVGAAFALGVFLAYLLVGIGFWRFLQSISFLAAFAHLVYLLTAALCLFLAFFSFLDYLKARRGEIEDMVLNLPHALRMRINRLIRQGSRARAYVWIAFVTGLAVSIIELACTGQVYLPTIIFVMGVPALRAKALVYLLLYNLLFILPLVVIFLLVFYGTTSKELTHFLQARAAAIKLAMAGLFLVLAGWLIYALV